MDRSGSQGIENPNGSSQESALPHLEGFAPSLEQHQSLSPELSPSGSQAGHDESRAGPSEPSAVRVRRRAQPNDEVKHRRTRSGCFTCRNRRVKCDEGRPTCDKCRKGNRPCSYPEPPPTKPRRGSAKAKQIAEDVGAASLHDSQDSRRRLPSITDEEGEFHAYSPTDLGTGSFTSTPSRREGSDPPSMVEGKSPASSVEDQAAFASDARRASTQSWRRYSIGQRSVELPQKIAFYLDFHRGWLSHHYYGIRCDSGNFIKTMLLEEALNYQPLLYAVVAFSAYHHTLTQPNGKVEDFFYFYTKSVSLLRASLQKNKKCSHATLLTILQLATFEEYLGDWLNVLSHRQAAHKILTELYTPTTVMRSEMHRKTLLWYQRYDLSAGLMSGYEALLGREWFVASYQFSVEQAASDPTNIGYKMEERFSSSRLLATDIAILMSRKGKGLLTDEEFYEESEHISIRLAEWYQHMSPELTNSGNVAATHSASPDPFTIFNPHQPLCLYVGDLWDMNYAFSDMWCIEMMFKFQLALAQNQSPTAETVNLAYKLCQTFEAIECYPRKPPGAILGAQANLGLACLILPKDERHNMWCRRKFVVVESLGFIYQPSFRTRLAELWGEDVSHWWLPNEEGLPPLIKSIREFVDRHPTVPRDKTSEDVRDMRGLFTALNLDDSSSSPTESKRSEGRAESFDSVTTGGIDHSFGNMELRSPDQAEPYFGRPDYQ